MATTTVDHRNYCYLILGGLYPSWEHLQTNTSAKSTTAQRMALCVNNGQGLVRIAGLSVSKSWHMAVLHGFLLLSQYVLAISEQQ